MPIKPEPTEEVVELTPEQTFANRVRKLRNEFFLGVDKLNNAINELEKVGLVVVINVAHYRTETIVNPIVKKPED